MNAKIIKTDNEHQAALAHIQIPNDKNRRTMKRAIELTLLFAVICSSHVGLAADPSPSVTTLRVALIGDSTVTDHAGWGKAFAGRFGEEVEVLNFAVSGRSSKSWYDEKRLPQVLEAKPDYVLIQFGHNGQPGKGPERETDPATTYRDYLKWYVGEFRAIGAKPIIVSSVTRRRFDGEGKIQTSLGPWAEAAKAVAGELKVPFVDLHAASVRYHNKIGPEASMAFNLKKGDVTHFNQKGAEAISELIIGELKLVAPDLCTHLKSAAGETGADRGKKG
jgi:pectinesterase